MSSGSPIHPEVWPPLPLDEWKPTRDTLHMWTQMVGKLRLRLAPPVNHWWHVPLYVSPLGLTTGAMPYRDCVLQATFDFLNHELVMTCNDRRQEKIGLYPRTVADFYREFESVLKKLSVDVRIWTMPVEVPNPISFEQDTKHASYDSEAVERFSRVLQTITPIFEEFRGRFIGKSSPVHFFWGSFDLAVTRFSGRRAPEREGADPITKEAYSHEVISAGWWPGGDSAWGPSIDYPAFYAYHAPAPEGFGAASVRPHFAFYHKELGEYLLKYDDVRTSADPRATLLEFCETTYEAGATLAKWDRKELEREASAEQKIA
jgi:hypothetical protein